jgi:protein ImuB
MLWACFTLPDLPLEAIFGCEAAETPCAVLDGPANRAQVRLANPVAAGLGIRPGHSLAAARVHAARLDARRRQPQAEAQCLGHLTAWAYGFSSQVVEAGSGRSMLGARQPKAATDAPASVLLEVGASLGLFGGWPQLERQLRAGLAELGHRHHLAAAPSPAGAQLLAEAGNDLAVLASPQLRNALGSIPLERCGLPPRLLQALQAVGWRRLDAVLRAPRAELARRFEPALPGWLDRLLGLAPDPRPLYRPPDRFERSIEFDLALDSLESLGFVLRRLCRELAAFLQARDGGLQQFVLQLGHDEAPATAVEIGLRLAQREAEPLFEAARGRLERTPLPGPVRHIGLIAERLPPFVPERRGLFDAAPRSGLAWPELQERLRARAGDDAVRMLQTHPDHRPECAWRSDPGNARRSVDRPPLAPRPLWLLPRPQPLRQPVLRLLSDPERIESGWWDDADVRRDYVIAELGDGQRAWLYREAGSGGPWMLHGWFA